MEKLFCKRNLIIGVALLGVILCVIFALVFGTTPASASNRKANVLIYCLVAVLLSSVMFNGIIKTIDKKTKLYFVIIFCLFAFWLGIKIFDKVSVFNDDNDYAWYLLYIPLLFIPTMWFITNNHIYMKNKNYKKIIAIIALSISLLLFLLVFTNDFHKFVFKFPDDTVSSHPNDYDYNVGYFIIYAFIFLEILTTVVLFYIFSVKKTTIKQKILPSVVILLVLIYSIVYVTTDISIPYLSDMTLVYTVLGTLLVYTSLKCGLIKNNGAYFEFFETCDVPLAIVNENANIEYQNTRYKKQKTNKDMLLQKQSLNRDTLLVLEDIGKLKNLQAKLQKEIEKLKYSNKILEKNKEVLQKQKQIEQHALLLNKIDNQIKDKKANLEQLLQKLPNEITEFNKAQTKETLNEIKTIVGYLKRKTSLILIAEQKDDISKNELKLLFNESFNDLKYFNVNAGIGLDERPVPVDIANKFYDIYNELMSKIEKSDLNMWLTIKKRDMWEFELTFDDTKIKLPDLATPKEYEIQYSATFDDGSTIICFKGASV